MLIVNLITIILIFFCLFLDVNRYDNDQWRLYRKRDLLLSSCHRAKCVLMTLNGDILDTVYCENDGKLGGTLLDIRFCALNNGSVITHEVRDTGQHIVKRERTAKVTMTCALSNIQPRNGGIVCTSFGIILILDSNNQIHFINETGKVVSSMRLNVLNIVHAERLFLDKHDRVWIKGKRQDGRHDEGVYITGLSK